MEKIVYIKQKKIINEDNQDLTKLFPKVFSTQAKTP